MSQLPTHDEAWQAFSRAWIDDGRPPSEKRDAFDAWWRGEDTIGREQIAPELIERYQELASYGGSD